MERMMRIDGPLTLEGWPLAMAYVPVQRQTEAFSPALALRRGVLYTALYKPFVGSSQGVTA